ncbi:TPA: hypothetical protein ACF2TC_002479, partial [Legionella pneumophila]
DGLHKARRLITKSGFSHRAILASRWCFALPQHERFNGLIKNLISLTNNKIIYSQFEKHKLFTNFKHQALNYPV